MPDEPKTEPQPPVLTAARASAASKRCQASDLVSSPSTTVKAFKLFVDQLHDGVVIVEGTERSVIYANSAFCSLIGRVLDEIVGRPLFEMFSTSNALLETVLTSPELPFEAILQSDQEPAPHVDITQVSLSPREATPIVGLIVKDKSNSSGAIPQPSHDSASVLSSRQKDHFIAMLGHELRNPLAPLRLAAELLIRERAPLSAIKRTIERQVSHMSRLVDDLLDAGRLSHGRLQMKRTSMLINDAIEASCESCNRLILRRGHTLEVNIEDTASAEINGDMVRVTQVISNLLSNAAKFTPNGGKIELSTAIHDDDVIITVTDNGRGIESQAIDSLFEPFTRASDTSDTDSSGLGLGLLLVQHIVAQHKGSINARSDGPEKGATFTVRLPRICNKSFQEPTPQESAVLPSSAPSQPPKKTLVERVLIVDDNEDAAQMLALILQTRGIDSDIAGDGEEALRRMLDTKYPLALVDIGLPQMSGLEVARQITNSPKRPKMLVALSGYGQQKDMENALSAGFDQYCVKPISIEQLNKLIET